MLRINQFPLRILLAIFAAVIVSRHPVAAQGSLTPPGAPGPMMKSLADIEPRTRITSLPFLITNSGSYYLATNFNGGGTLVGIFIQASGVGIDMRGFSLANCSVGISADTATRNISVQNGFVRGCVGAGLDLGNASRCQLENMVVSENGGAGAAVGAGSLVTSSTASANSGAGFTLGDGSEIHGCIVQSNNASGIVLGANCMANHNTCTANGGGAGMLLSGNANRVENNTCSRNSSFGIRATGTNNFVFRNNAAGNATQDFSLVAGNHYGQVLTNPGAAFVSSNAWANFSVSP